MTTRLRGSKSTWNSCGTLSSFTVVSSAAPVPRFQLQYFACLVQGALQYLRSLSVCSSGLAATLESSLADTTERSSACRRARPLSLLPRPQGSHPGMLSMLSTTNACTSNCCTRRFRIPLRRKSFGLLARTLVRVGQLRHELGCVLGGRAQTVVCAWCRDPPSQSPVPSHCGISRRVCTGWSLLELAVPGARGQRDPRWRLELRRSPAAAVATKTRCCCAFRRLQRPACVSWFASPAHTN